MEHSYLVSVLLPTRGRPELMLKSVASLLTTASNPDQIQILLKIDNDDKETYQEAYSSLQDLTSHFKILYSPRGLGYGDLHTHVNDLCAIAEGEYLFLWNDDATITTHGWDDIIREHQDGLHGNPVAVIQIDNNHAWKFGFPLVHKKIYETIGYFSLNAHNDTWIHWVAERAGVERMEWRIMSEHDRYDLTADPKMRDETYTDIWNEQHGGYHQTHQLLISNEQTLIREQDSLKIRNMIEG